MPLNCTSIEWINEWTSLQHLNWRITHFFGYCCCCSAAVIEWYHHSHLKGDIRLQLRVQSATHTHFNKQLSAGSFNARHERHGNPQEAPYNSHHRVTSATLTHCLIRIIIIHQRSETTRRRFPETRAVLKAHNCSPQPLNYDCQLNLFFGVLRYRTGEVLLLYHPPLVSLGRKPLRVKVNLSFNSLPLRRRVDRRKWMNRSGSVTGCMTG